MAETHNIIIENVTHDITDGIVTHEINTEVVTHEIGAEQGPPGPPGADGEAGPAGGTGPRAYTHEQSTASATWTCNHNLGFIPNIQIEDSIGDLVYPDKIANGINQSIIYFAISMAGIAHLS